MRTLLLYSALSNELEKVITEDVDYSITNGFLDYGKDYGISTFITDVAPSRTRLSGQKYEGHTATFQFMFQGGTTPESSITIRSIMCDVEDFIAALNNKQIKTTDEFEILPNGKIHRITDKSPRQVTDSSGVNIFVSHSVLVSSVIPLGKNENGRQIFSLNAAIAYYITGNAPITNANNSEPADNSELENIKQEE